MSYNLLMGRGLWLTASGAACAGGEEVSHIADGNTAAKGCWGDGVSDGWALADLGQRCRIDWIRVYHASAEASVFLTHDFSFSVADTVVPLVHGSASLPKVVDVVANAADPSTHILNQAAFGRYILFDITLNTQDGSFPSNRIYEWEVWGVHAPQPRAFRSVGVLTMVNPEATASAATFTPADNFAAGSAKLFTSAATFSPGDAFAATGRELFTSAATFSPADSFAATGRSAGSAATFSPTDSFAAAGASLFRAAATFSPGDTFAATAAGSSAGAATFSPGDVFAATGAALFAASGGATLGFTGAATGASRFAAGATFTPADSFTATSASLFAASATFSPTDDFEARSPSTGTGGSSEFFTTVQRPA